ncbi:NADH dehydrogenase subunit E [Bosea sp. 62]|uniref:NADH-quinone oxidoreductase subunit NuoE n=1 Tax=unclassified Bosea (in: a-proteobacteria) TaxID=2653178 RepID=UPI00125842C6|nr:MULTISPECIES: NADH-quinone oxidoreductase subunit NuoE [unclassified Bosea (in: a-proteobacteria)]CAD5257346.1 NADH dehydrogenase subunit E [Bosea sp. 46]CAD5261791.1 NADH dehydrogenase subunit E [Bosea sp. 21B]CAD5278761.1 NADH dehydrogenase subunit E [Bosea sp. 7B]VVT58555.1 NADH dehydrogenase subunit E [Bosea sp. EC-HK365B]VXB56249.1 NADH dehydrogenase subunit E [Bosea sp. 29B]
MSVRRLAPDHVQPASFAFTAANENWADQQIAKYPEGRQASAVIPLLWKAQEQHHGWLPRAAIEAVAHKLGMAPMRVLEVATFYTMFNLQPVGTHFVQLCGTTPCALRGAEALKKVCEDVIGPQSTVTPDGKLSWLEVECLGACCNAPMAQINFDYYEDLNPANFRKLLEDLRHGRPTKPGPQVDRSCSEPLGGGDTLKDPALYNGSVIGAGDWQKRISRQREEAAIRIASEKAAAEAKAKAEAETAAATAKAGPTDVKTAPAPEAAAPARPKPSEPNQPASAAQDTPSATSKAIKDTPAKAPAAKAAPAAEPAPAVAESKPQLLTAARGGKGDDLELIWGVGPKLGKMLNEMGIWHFDQVAAWTPAELAWVDARLTGFKGRAVRDDWISQAKKLATGWRPESKLGDKPAN